MGGGTAVWTFLGGLVLWVAVAAVLLRFYTPGGNHCPLSVRLASRAVPGPCDYLDEFEAPAD